MTSLRIADLGPNTYSRSAAKVLTPDVERVWVVEQGSAGIEQVVEYLLMGDADVAVVPVRTHHYDIPETLGSVHEAITRMEDNGRQLHIVGEYRMPVDYYLGVKPGTAVGEVEVLASKDEPLRAARKELKAMLGNVEYVRTPTTSDAAMMVADSKEYSMAALCNEEAIQAYGLEKLLEQPIRKTTSFIALSRAQSAGRQDETALLVRCYEDSPGQLYGILGAVMPHNMSALLQMSNMADRHGTASNVYVIRIEADLESAMSAVGRIREELAAKENARGVVNGSRVDVLGSYPVYK
ncbi:hypothetical protein HYX10_05300 [Candidatus Woesearchaeota archaeon]|nr:hypothetical protein [Candidatus Woesearchaeota archaeon]